MIGSSDPPVKSSLNDLYCIEWDVKRYYTILTLWREREKTFVCQKQALNGTPTNTTDYTAEGVTKLYRVNAGKD